MTQSTTFAATPITRNSIDLSIEGHEGFWYVIDQKFVGPTFAPRTIFLLEHQDHGDEAACLIVDEVGSIILDDVHNGFEDLYDFADGQLKETRHISSAALRTLCIDRRWFTLGSNEEYGVLLHHAHVLEDVTTRDIAWLANYIAVHSDTNQGVTSIAYDIAQIVRSSFVDSAKQFIYMNTYHCLYGAGVYEITGQQRVYLD